MASIPVRETPSFPIVGIGASAGGLEAFREVLRFLPVDTGIAYVFVQHLDPTHESLLTALLARATQMEVCEVDAPRIVEPNHVYVIAPNTDLLLEQGVLTLQPQTTSRGQHLSIDTFLCSLAENQASQAIGVLLSGMASDGTRGLEAIKERGGITLAQDAQSALYSMMPQNAIASGCVDFIGSPEELARELTRISRHPYLQQSPVPETAGATTQAAQHMLEPAFSDTERVVQQIARVLRQKTGVDFTAYKPTTLMRRIRRRLVVQHLGSLAEYLTMLREKPAEVDALYQDILIGVTSFFRDPSTYSLLKREAFGHLVETKSPRDPIRVWVPGCSTGEEVYSLAICLLEFLTEYQRALPLQLFGTDLNPRAIEQARVGLYSSSVIEQLPHECRERFFHPVGEQYQVNKPLRDLCIFARHDLLRDPPFSHLDVLSCQNVLIYLQPDIQQKLIQIFHYALLPQGVLVLGASETIRAASELFTREGSRKQPLYRKKTSSTRPPFIGPVSGSRDHSPYLPEEEHRMRYEESTREGTSQKEADSLLLDRFAPASLVVDAEMEICHFRGPVSPYLEPTSGKASLNLFKMVRQDLRLELRAALGQARKSGHAVKKAGIQVRDQNQFRDVAVEVIPLKDRAFLILFTQDGVPAEEQTVQAKAEEHPEARVKPDARDRRIRQLEQELLAKREEMRSIIEEMEATNEELQSANEEILSGNEELQSLNEELETSKEEIQASNEELLVVNQELSLRNTDLQTARAYAEAIVETIREPLLVLNIDLRVQSANHAFYRYFQTTSEETEQQQLFALGDGQWNIPALRTGLVEVLSRNHRLIDYEVEHTFARLGQRTILLNARRVEDNALILLALEDITERKLVEREQQKLLEQREEFLGIASHELKTPVTSIKGYTQMLQRRFAKAGDEQAAALMTRMDEQLDRLIHLIGALLDLTQIEAGQLPWHNEMFDLGALVREVVEEMAHTTVQHQIRIEGMVQSSVWADRERISEVLTNLLSNAIKYSPQAESIRVTLHEKQRSATIGVQDFGIGIDPEKQKQVFNRFFRVSDSEHATFPGLGLGLYISAQIVKKQGGRMWVDSTAGTGSTFFFTIPCAPQETTSQSQKEGQHVKNHPDRRG
ncbi:MAG TPA: chemotaxis protein CheB [Ktedonobacteraceae bacterium]